MKYENLFASVIIAVIIHSLSNISQITYVNNSEIGTIKSIHDYVNSDGKCSYYIKTMFSEDKIEDEEVSEEVYMKYWLMDKSELKKTPFIETKHTRLYNLDFTIYTLLTLAIIIMMLLNMSKFYIKELQFKISALVLVMFLSINVSFNEYRTIGYSKSKLNIEVVESSFSYYPLFKKTEIGYGKFLAKIKPNTKLYLLDLNVNLYIIFSCLVLIIILFLPKNMRSKIEFNFKKGNE